MSTESEVVARMNRGMDRLKDQRNDARAEVARLRAIVDQARALADEWERDEAYACVNASECLRCVSFQRAVIRLRAALAPVEPSGEAEPRSWPQHADLAQIDAQREKGWPDFHPEDFCHRCGHRNVSWYVASATWNAVMRGGDPAGWGDWQEIICPPCFTELAEPHGFTAWRVTRDEHGTWSLAPSPTQPSGEAESGEVAQSLDMWRYLRAALSPVEPFADTARPILSGETVAALYGHLSTGEAESDPDAAERYLRTLESMHPDDVMQERIDRLRESHDPAPVPLDGPMRAALLAARPVLSREALAEAICEAIPDDGDSCPCDDLAGKVLDRLADVLAGEQR